MNVNGRLKHLEGQTSAAGEPGDLDFSTLDDSTIDFLAEVIRMPNKKAERALAHWAAENPAQFEALKALAAGAI